MKNLSISFKKFSSNPQMEYDPVASEEYDTDVWRITRAFDYFVGEREDNSWIHIPEGFLTDGATVPRIFWGIVPPWGSYGPAVIVHDYLCKKKPVFVNGEFTIFGRKKTDKVLLEAMTVLNVPKWQKYLIYSAVRLYAYCTLDFS